MPLTACTTSPACSPRHLAAAPDGEIDATTTPSRAPGRPPASAFATAMPSGAPADCRCTATSLMPHPLLLLMDALTSSGTRRLRAPPKHTSHTREAVPFSSGPASEPRSIRRELCWLQKMLPQRRQWWRRSMRVNFLPQPAAWQCDTAASSTQWERVGSAIRGPWGAQLLGVKFGAAVN